MRKYNSRILPSKIRKRRAKEKIEMQILNAWKNYRYKGEKIDDSGCNL